MKPIIHPRLVNGPFGDPGLYIEFLWESRAVLFDLGNNLSLTSRKLLKVTDVFISHTHIDHFIGFDNLLRILLGKDTKLRLFGPPGIISHVEGKLSSYTWNLIEEYPFSIEVFEVGNRAEAALFRAKDGFKREESPFKKSFSGTILKEPRFIIHTVSLNHRTPSLAFSLKERFHINVNKERLKRLKLPVGPWLKELKEDIWEGKGRDTTFTIRWEEDGKTKERAFTLGFLMDEIVTITQGQKITYVVDAVFNDENKKKIIELVRGSDLLFCEAAYLDIDRNKAQERYHLTAKDAGFLAREAGVKRLEVFHFSPRYQDNPDEIIREAMEEFCKKTTDNR